MCTVSFRSFRPGVVLIGGTSFPIASSLAEGPGRNLKKGRKSTPYQRNRKTITRKKLARKKRGGSKGN